MLTRERFEDHLASSGLWPSDGVVVVGYSGGADSSSLIHMLASGGRDVVAAHLHHGMRTEADRELELCAAFCESLSVPFMSGHADVPAIAAERKVGLEEAGRIARYTFLRHIGVQLSAVRVATAHTRSDHVETVLLHILRGSGLRGLGGIAAESGDLIRPLLPYSRAETRGYCDAEGLWYHDDPANESDRFARSRLRTQVSPVFASINPNYEAAIARLTEVVRDEDDFLDGAAAAALERLEIPLNGDLGFLTRNLEIALDVPHMRHLPKPLIRRAVRLCFETLGNVLGFEQTAIVLDGLLGETPGSVTAEGGETVAEWDSVRLVIARRVAASAFSSPLSVPGRFEFEPSGWAIEASREPRGSQLSERAALTVWLDEGRIDGALELRGLRAGDRVRPLGFVGHRKLAELMREQHLTELARARLPILCDGGGPLWAPGVALDDRVKITDDTEHVVKISFSDSRAG